jgi:hypothetical protein
MGSHWDSGAGHDGESLIIRSSKKPVAPGQPFQSRVAKAIHLSRKAVTSAMGRRTKPRSR